MSKLKAVIAFLFLFSSFFLQSQCLDSTNKKGYFDTNSVPGIWWRSNDSSFTIDKTDPFYGSGSLKVEKTSGVDVRMFTTSSCFFEIENNQSWNVSLYIKGEVGDKLDFSLIDGSNNNSEIGTKEHTIQYKGWHYVRLNLLSTSSTSQGKIRIIFKNDGTYWLDNIVLNKGSFNKWYVDDDGSDNNDGTIDKPFKTLKKALSNNDCIPGDIIYVKDGIYTNDNYGSGGKSNGAVLNINSSYNGTIDLPVVIRNYPGESPKINFDGSGGFIIGTATNPVNHVEIAGFEIQGPNQNITYEEAKSWRDSYVANNTQSLKNYYHGRGIAIWGGTYINIHNNKVYDCPNSGIRANNSDYMRVAFNEVYNNTWWSFNAESAIVFAQSKSIDSDLIIKMRIENNLVYNNMNRLPFYSKNKPCTGTDRYGCADQDYIIDGSGSYITRNNDDGIEPRDDDENPNGQYVGRFYFANNINYGNGINGLVVHKTDNTVVTNNLAYVNGAVPTNAELSDIANDADAPAWKKALKSGRQDTSGIVVHTSANVKLHNNITWAKFSDEWAFQTFGAISNLEKRRNLIGNGKGKFAAENNNGTIAYYEADPKFVDPDNFNFKLKNDSPAIDKGENNSYNPTIDYDYVKRSDNNIDIGPFEYVNNVGSDSDSDGIIDSNDNCPDKANSDQKDSDGDGIGDVCDEDDNDNDGVVFFNDNCPFDWNPLQRDDDNNGEGDICDNNYIITSVYENSPPGYLHSLSEFLPSDVTSFNIVNGNSDYVFSISELNLKLDKQLNFNQKNIYKLEINYDSNQKIKPKFIILYVNYILTDVAVKAEKVESTNLSSKFEKHVLYDPYLDLIDEDKRLKMWDVHFTFGSFFGSGPNEEIAFEYDYNKDGLNDLTFGSSRINYNGYIFGGGHMGKSPLYLINKGNFEFDLSVNSFENKSIQHSITYKRIVDIDNDDIPEIFNFGEHYHVRRHNPYYKLQRKWKESKGIFLDKDYSEDDFKKIRYFKISDDGELIDMSNKINDPSTCTYSIYQNGSADIDNDGDIDFVFGTQVYWGSSSNCNIGEHSMGILRNIGDGNFDLEWLGNGDFVTSEGHLLLEDISGDGFKDIIFSGPTSLGGYIHYMLNDGNGSFNYTLDNKIDNPVQGMRNVFLDDIDNDSTKEIIIFNTNGFGAGGAVGLPNIIKIYNFQNSNGIITFNDVSEKYFSNNENEMDFYSQNTWMKYIDLDYDGYKDLVPKFLLEDPNEEGAGWDYPGNGYTKDWNNSKGFQYYKFDPKTKKFIIKNLGIIDKIETGNSNCNVKMHYYNNYDFYDIDNDGYFEWITLAMPGPWSSNNSDDQKCMKASVIIYKMIDFFDDDNDGVYNQNDQCPDTPAGSTVDINGCKIFELPINNYKVEVASASCIGTSDGVIDLSVEDASFDYTVTITGKDNVTITGTSKTGSVTGLAKGTYEVCFKVDGQANYEQCFEVVVGEPPALTAFIDIDNDNKKTSITMSGSNIYNVTINGMKQSVNSNTFETELSTGLNIIRVDTDLECQGFVEKEVFISEDIHYYPNPTDNDVKVHVGGKDTRVKVSVFSEKGDLIYTRYQDIADESRKTNIDLVNQVPGTYIVILESKTVRKTFKVIRK